MQGLSPVCYTSLIASKTFDPKRLLTLRPVRVRTKVQIAPFMAGDKRKVTHQLLFLPKDYSGSPTASIFTPFPIVRFQQYSIRFYETLSYSPTMYH